MRGGAARSVCVPEFTGEYRQILDTKGRVFVPAKIREAMDDPSGKVYLTRGLDGCAYMYAPAQWKAVVTLVQSQPFTSASVRRFHRGFAGSACECTMDKQGRILIPETLRQLAGLKRDVVFLGQFDKVEIWDVDRYAAQSITPEEYNQSAEEMFKR